MSLKRFLEDYRVPYTTDREQAGWLHIKCPVCGDRGTHLGVNIDNWGLNCFRCDIDDRVVLLIRLLRITKSEAIQILKKYGGETRKPSKSRKEVVEPVSRVELPVGTLSGLNRIQSDYVESRGFHAGYLERTWELMSTGPVSYLDDIDYRFRILVPIFWEGRMVSFQCRDVTGRSKIRYLTCPEKIRSQAPQTYPLRTPVRGGIRYLYGRGV